MASKKKAKIVVALKCTVCGERNYYKTKQRTFKKKLEFNKYCPRCNKHTKHVETKI